MFSFKICIKLIYYLYQCFCFIFLLMNKTIKWLVTFVYHSKNLKIQKTQISLRWHLSTSHRWLENHLSVLHTVWRHDNVDVIISIVLRKCFITLLNNNKIAYLLYIDVFINTSDIKSNILNIKYEKFSSFKGLYYVNAYLYTNDLETTPATCNLMSEWKNTT